MTKTGSPRPIFIMIMIFHVTDDGVEGSGNSSRCSVGDLLRTDNYGEVNERFTPHPSFAEEFIQEEHQKLLVEACIKIVLILMVDGIMCDCSGIS